MPPASDGGGGYGAVALGGREVAVPQWSVFALCVRVCDSMALTLDRTRGEGGGGASDFGMVKTQAAATDTIYLQAVTQALPCFLCCVCYCVVAVHPPWWLLL